MSDAWKAKLEQAYQKASFMLAKEGEFKEVLILHQKTQEEIKRAKKKASRIVLWFWVVIVVIFVFLVSLASKEEIKENERLENIIVEVQEFLDKQEYNRTFRLKCFKTNGCNKTVYGRQLSMETRNGRVAASRHNRRAKRSVY